MRRGSLLLGLAFVAGWLSTSSGLAAVKLPALFSDHMVLQADRSVPIWGWADPEEIVTITVGDQSWTATAGADGRWQAALGPFERDQELSISVKGTNELTIKDVLVGEVWLASGQSNMAMTVDRCLNLEQEKAQADFPKIRMFTVTSGAATTPQTECTGVWTVCSPETVGRFSGTAYFFGKALHQELGVPVGLINSSVGGTSIEAWTSMEPQVARPELKDMLADWRRRDETYQPEVAQKRYETALAKWQKDVAEARAAGTAIPRRPQAPVRPREDRNHPANLFNGKIAPLIPYAIRGAIWYQGENNCRPDVADLYRIQLPLLIADWRARWGEGDFPFAWVQLPNFNAPADRQWPLVREGMLTSLSVPQTGMATCLDLGEADDIHPRNKQDVGRRLANWALYTVHGRPRVTSGPLPLKHATHGRDVEVWFRYGEGLKFVGEPEGFEIAGPDGKFVPATAKLGNGSVILSSPEVENPTQVRYAWSNNPKSVLVNNASLPASPFRLIVKQP